MGTTSEIARRIAIKRWKDPKNRQQQSLAVRRRIKPRRPPEMPEAVDEFTDTLSSEGVTCISATPTMGTDYYPDGSWVLSVVDPAPLGYQRYEKLASGVGLHVHSYVSNPLPKPNKGTGWAVVCVLVTKP